MFSYTRSPNFVGSDSFSLTISDDLDAYTAIVNIQVTNNAPYAYDASFSVLHDRELTGQVYGYDPDGDAITASVVTGPSYGRLDFNPDGTFSYIPNSYFVGLDSFTYEVSDAINQAQGTISIEVWNRPPVTFPSEITLYEAQEVFIAVAGLAIDPDGDTYSFTLQDSEWNGAVTLEQGILHYRAPINWSGQETIRLLVSDGLDESEAVISIQVDRIEPGAAHDSYVIDVRRNHYPDGVVSMPAASGVLANDFAAGGRTLTASLVQAPSFAGGGSFTLASDGSFAYALAENFLGEDSFQYIASDGYAQTQVATVRLLITDGAQAVDNVFELSEANRDEQGWYLMRPEEGLLVNDYIPPDARIVGLELLPSRNPELFELVPQHDPQGNIVAAGIRIYVHHPAEVEDIEVRYRIMYEIGHGSNVRLGQSEAQVCLYDPYELFEDSLDVMRVVSDYLREGLGEAMATVASIIARKAYDELYKEPAQKHIESALKRIAAARLWNHLLEKYRENERDGPTPRAINYVFSPEDREGLALVRVAGKQIWEMFTDDQLQKLRRNLLDQIGQAPALAGKRWELEILPTHYQAIVQRTVGNFRGPPGLGRGLHVMLRPVLVGRLTVQGRSLTIVVYGQYVAMDFPDAFTDFSDLGDGVYIHHKSEELRQWYLVTKHLLQQQQQQR